MVVCQPTLYILATNHKYDEIVARLLKNETSSLEWQDFQGNTVLHILCRQDRMSKQAIDAVIEKRPLMIDLRNQSSWTPLHLACHQRIGIAPELLPQIDAIRLGLILACPSAVSTRRESGYARENPLEMACTARADIVVLEAMLCIDSSLAMPQKDPANIVKLLQQLWNSNLKDHVALILLTAYFGRVVEDRRSFLLHAACFQRIPRDCFEEILRENRDQVLIPDHLGNLPLHHAVSQRQIQPEAITGFIVTSLLELEPDSAHVRNHEGRFALHCALDHPRMTWHQGGLSKLAPLSFLSACDPRTGLYPLQMAALHANLSRLYLSTLYEIMRSAPEVVQSAIPTDEEQVR